jgi:hypothetical protein
MDRKLLDALNNLSFALEEIAESLNNKGGDKGNKSATTTALQGGKLDEQLKSIDKGVKQLQSDNKKILKNQETLLELSKKSPDKKETPLDNASDPKQKSKLKDGLASIMMIAVGVLAIGLAFKLIGNVNFLSVIALAIALPLVAMAFEKIAKMKDLKPAEMKNLVLVSVAMAVAITLSSYILSMVKPVGPAKLFTAIIIAGMFAVASYGIGKFLIGLKKADINPVKDWKMLASLPIVMLAISVAIALSSYALQLVMPVGIFKLFTAILIAAMFGAVAFGIGHLLVGLKKAKIDPIKDGKMLAALPIVLVGISLAIALSSYALQLVMPISPSQFFTSVMIAIVFIPISFALPFIAKAMKDIDIKRIALLPIMMVAMAAAIWLSSLILVKVQKIDSGLLFNIIFQAITLAVIGIALGFTMKFLAKIGPEKLLEGGIGIIIIAGAIMVSSLLLSLGDYNNGPSPGWAIGFGLTVLFLAPAVILLGIVGLPIVIMGAIGLVIMAAAITAASYILAYIKPDFFYTLADAFSYFMKKIAEAIGYGLKVIAPGLKFFIDVVGSSLIKFAKNIIPVIVGAVEMLMNRVVKPFISFIMPFLPTIVKLVLSVIDALTPVFKIITDLVKNLFETVSSMLKTFKDIIKEVGDTIVKIVDSISGGISKALGKIKEVIVAIGNAISKIIDAIGNSFAKIGNSITNVINAVVGGVERLAKVGLWDLGEAAVNIGTFLVAVTGYILTFTKTKFNFKNFNNIRWLFDSMTNLTKSFGKVDPFVKIGSSIDSFLSKLNKLKVNKENPFKQLSDSVDQLVSSMSKLNTSVDLDKLSAVNSLTGSIVMLSLMDSEQFSKMMDALEDKSKILLDVMENTTKRAEKPEGNRQTITPIKSGSVAGNPAKSMNDLFMVMQSVDQKLASIAKSNDNLSKYVDEIRSSDIDLKGKK